MLDGKYERNIHILKNMIVYSLQKIMISKFDINIIFIGYKLT